MSEGEARASPPPPPPPDGDGDSAAARPRPPPRSVAAAGDGEPGARGGEGDTGSSPAPGAPAPPPAGGEGAEGGQNDGSGPSAAEEAAATRIQAMQRGRQARARVALMRAGGGDSGEEANGGVGEGAGDRGASDEPARLTFVLVPEGFTLERECPVTTTVASITHTLAEELRSGDASLSLRAPGGEACDDPGATLRDLGLAPGQEAQMELALEYGAPPAPKTFSGIKDKLDVEVDQGMGMPAKIIEVTIDRSALESNPKRWLGGYRNKRTGTTYLHGSTQTARRADTRATRYTRDTQTSDAVARTVQTGRDASTQMARRDLLLDTSGDVEATPGRYVTSEEWALAKVEAALVIQRHARGRFARRMAAEMRRRKEERAAFMEAEAKRARADAEARREVEIRRRMHPRTAADFEILYSELEAWRVKETEGAIAAAGDDQAARQRALQGLLQKETKLLQTIDRLKIAANQENRDRRIARELAEMGQPKTWEMADGTTVDVITPFTTRAQELQQLYHGLKLPLLSTDERLDVLLHIKWTVKEFDCSLTREIVDLIDREADLLNRGRSPKTLAGLRQRVANLFLQFCETPEFNPESAKFSLVPLGAEEATYA